MQLGEEMEVVVDGGSEVEEIPAETHALQNPEETGDDLQDGSALRTWPRAHH